MKRLPLRVLAALFAIALLAAACGDSDETSTDETTDTTEETADTTEEMAEGEVGSIVDGVAIGTSGFTIDTNECPSGWSNTQGVTDDEVLMGHSYVFSGALAAYGATSDGMKAWFEYQSTENPDAYGGRTVKLISKDDAYEPARVVTNVQELIENEGIFGVTTLAGTPGNLASYDYLNEQCVPHLLASSGHPAWGDPVNHPWSTPSFLSYTTEGGIWASHILAEQEAGRLPDPVRVATLTMNNDFGLAMLNGFKASVEDSGGKIEIVGDELFDPAAPNVTNEITTLGGTNADVAIVGTAGVTCTQAMQSVAESSWEPTLKIIAAVCTASFFEAAGETGDGWVQAGGGKDMKSSVFDDDTLIQEAREVFDDAGIDWQNNSNAGLALLYAIPTLKALEDANSLPGGITRTNAIIGARSADFQNGYYLDGIRWHMDGLDDVYAIEGSQLVRWTLDEDLGYAQQVNLDVPR